MSRSMGFGIGAGAATVLCGLLALSPVVRGSAAVEKAKSKGKAEGSSTADRTEKGDTSRKIDREIRIVHRGGTYLGVRLEDVGKEDVARLKLGEERGVLVKAVEDDSPAQKAGLEEGDVIVRYHGEAVISAAQLARLVKETPAGRSVAIEVLRDGVSQKLSAAVDERPRNSRLEGPESELELDWPDMDIAPPKSSAPQGLQSMPDLRGFDRWGKRAFDKFEWFGTRPRKLGVEYTEISGQLAQYFKLSEKTGLLVTSVDDEGPAAKAGLKAGDVIVKLGSRSILDAEDLQRALEKTEPGEQTALTVMRDGRAVDLKVTLGGKERNRERDKDETAL